MRSPTGALSRQEADRLHVFLHAVAFVAGFTVVFTLLGSAMGLIGHSLNIYLPMIQKMGALLLVLFALITLGLFRWLARTIEARIDIAPTRRRLRWSASATFSTGCSTPRSG